MLHEALMLSLEPGQLLAVYSFHSREIQGAVLPGRILRLYGAVLISYRRDVLLKTLALLHGALLTPQPVEWHCCHAVGRVEHPAQHAHRRQARNRERDRVEPVVLHVEQVPYPPRGVLLAVPAQGLCMTGPKVQAHNEEDGDETNEEGGGAQCVAAVCPVGLVIKIARAPFLPQEVRVRHENERKSKERREQHQVSRPHMLLGNRDMQGLRRNVTLGDDIDVDGN
mmetsp:Transcript_47054/g.102403  ORF Transcript_47054/g.102403 Transcript_47054/m.102403 type:complete len:225 (+) Transcript_47054:871-1545(+)